MLLRISFSCSGVSIRPAPVGRPRLRDLSPAAPSLRLGDERGGLDVDRCALMVRRNSEHPAHNGYELATLFLAWVLGEGGDD